MNLQVRTGRSPFLSNSPSSLRIVSTERIKCRFAPSRPVARPPSRREALWEAWDESDLLLGGTMELAPRGRGRYPRPPASAGTWPPRVTPVAADPLSRSDGRAGWRRFAADWRQPGHSVRWYHHTRAARPAAAARASRDGPCPCLARPASACASCRYRRPSRRPLRTPAARHGLVLEAGAGRRLDARWIALLPLINPITCDTAYFGGIEINMCT